MVLTNSFRVQSVDWHPLVLVLDADEDTRLMMKYLLQIWKYSVIETVEVEEALTMTAVQKPDFILFSGNVQPGDCSAEIRQLRELSASGEMRIIFISAFAEPTLRDSALAAGADAFLVKPIDFGKLERILQMRAQTAH